MPTAEPVAPQQQLEAERRKLQQPLRHRQEGDQLLVISSASAVLRKGQGLFCPRKVSAMIARLSS